MTPRPLPLLLRALCVQALAFACSQAQNPIVVKILPTPTGTLKEAVSTSFQSAPWTDPAFLAHPEIPRLLTDLNPHHINVQIIDQSIPETAPDTWDFTALDRQLQPILASADHSPLLQLAAGPAFLGTRVTAAYIAGYAAYAATMVKHYPAIHYWGILNEPNYFHVSPTEYVAIYNAAAPAMRAANPSIKLVALELGGEPKDERTYLPIFVRNVKAPVDIVGVHFYATCDRTDSDHTLFNTVPAFSGQLQYLYRELRATPQLRATPIWILENNVNADFIDDHGQSTCDTTQTFEQDPRGASAFFPAWRAYEFSRFGKAGAQALYHWVFNGNTQYGEYNTEDTPPRRQLSYWIDYWLSRYYPPDAPAQILTTTNPDPANLEVLTTRDPTGAVTMLISNHTVSKPTDNNGKGRPRTITLDLTGLGEFTRATRLTIDTNTDTTKGPTPQEITPTRRMTLSFTGYGVTFLTLSKTNSKP